MADDRRAEIAANLTAVRARVEAACVAADRDLEEITLIVVTKAFPSSDVLHCVDLGIRDCGENRDQEARVKVAKVHEIAGNIPVRWHFVGRLQRNKAASVARYADVVHSVDRPELVHALERGAQRAGREIDVCVQVCLDEQPGRGGAMPDDVLSVAGAVSQSGALRLRGVMAVAPLGRPPDPAFSRLAGVARELREAYPQAGWISAGMSGDLEEAIKYGATHLRVGAGVLGKRTTNGYGNERK